MSFKVLTGCRQGIDVTAFRQGVDLDFRQGVDLDFRQGVDLESVRGRGVLPVL